MGSNVVFAYELSFEKLLFILLSIFDSFFERVQYFFRYYHQTRNFSILSMMMVVYGYCLYDKERKS